LKGTQSSQITYLQVLQCATSYYPGKLERNRREFVKANKKTDFAAMYPDKWIAFHSGEVVSEDKMSAHNVPYLHYRYQACVFSAPPSSFIVFPSDLTRPPPPTGPFCIVHEFEQNAPFVTLNLHLVDNPASPTKEVIVTDWEGLVDTGAPNIYSNYVPQV
jgi:hypothetical protein